MSRLRLVSLVVVCLAWFGCAAEEPVDPFNFAGDSTFLSYSQGYKLAQEKKLPFFVMVGAEWCGACTSTKTALKEIVDARTAEGKVVISVVDYDAQNELALSLMTGGGIPQQVRYPSVAGGAGTVKRNATGLGKAALEAFILNP